MKLPNPAKTPVGAGISAVIGPPGLKDPERLRAEVDGKVVVITGASFGLGEATARLVAEAGGITILAARTTERLNEIAGELTARGHRAHPHGLDLADPASIREFAQWVQHEFGAPDVLVHNAGKSLRRSVALSYNRPKDLEATSGVNYLGPIRLTLALLPGMRARGSGHIVNVSTVGIQFPPTPKWGFYISSKAAFDTWIRSVAMETRPDGVSMTTFYAGLMHTRMSAPSGWMRFTPGQTPKQAARVVARAIVQKPRVIAPIYGRPAEILAPMLRTPLELWMEFIYRYLPDTKASLRSASQGRDNVVALDKEA